MHFRMIITAALLGAALSTPTERTCLMELPRIIEWTDTEGDDAAN